MDNEQIAGLRYPVLSAELGLAWCVARVFYTLGYVKSSKAQGNGRLIGNWFWLAEIGLQFIAMWTGWKLLSS